MTITKNAWAAVVAVLATMAVVLALVFVPTNSASGAAGYTEWANEGAVVVTHENVAPGTDTDTTRWLPVGEPTKHVTVEAVPAGPFVATGETVDTDNENVVPEAAGENCRWVAVGPVDDNTEDVPAGPVTYQNWTWNPGTDWVEPADGLGPYFPDTTKHGVWNSNNGNHTGHPQPGSEDVNSRGNYFMSHGSSGNGDWFHWEAIPGTPAVEGKDFRWAKECQTPAVAEVSHLDYQWQKQVRTVITDNPTTPTETPETPVVTPEVPVETPTETETPEVPTEEETPVSIPQPEDDSSLTVVRECVGGSLVIQKFNEDGQKVFSSNTPTDKCADKHTEQTGEPVIEEGL